MSKRIKALIGELEEMLLAMQPVPPENTWLSLATMLRQSKNLLTSANTLAKRLKVDFEEAKPVRIDDEPSLGVMIIVDGSGLGVPHEPAGCVVRMKVTGTFPPELGAMYFGGHIADVVAMNLDRAFDTLKVSSDDTGPVPMNHEPVGELEGAITLARSEGYSSGIEAERDLTRQVAAERDVQRARADTAELALAKTRAAVEAHRAARAACDLEASRPAESQSSAPSVRLLKVEAELHALLAWTPPAYEARSALVREVVRRSVVEMRRRMIAVVKGDEEIRLVIPDILDGITPDERAVLGVAFDAWKDEPRS